MDDIEDDSQLRRGQPGNAFQSRRDEFDVLTYFSAVTHKIYGIPQTINTANYVYFLAYQELFALRRSQNDLSPERDLDAIVTGSLAPHPSEIPL